MKGFSRPLPDDGPASPRVVIALVADAYGGRGGIAQYNRYFLKAVCSQQAVGRVIALPRAIRYQIEELPKKIEYVAWAAGGLFSYALAVMSLLVSIKRADLIICGHLHLLPFAKLLQIKYGCRIVPLTYGIEAWKPTRHYFSNWLCRNLDGFISIRRLTAELLISWAKPKNAHYYYLPNCVEPAAFGLAPKRSDLIERYGLRNMKVVMTAGRIDSMPSELCKGFDEVLTALPKLAGRVSNIKYLIMGDGTDIVRLETLASSLGVRDRVVFTGYVSEADKADHYRLADVFAMPGSSPNFDTYPFRFVFLEALACGVPVVGARVESHAEASDPDVQELIVQVDPKDTDDIVRGILLAMKSAGKGIKNAMTKFYYDEFEAQTCRALADVWKEHLCQSQPTASGK